MVIFQIVEVYIRNYVSKSRDTRWDSHYGFLVNLIVLFASVIDVFKVIVEEGVNLEQRGKACALRLDIIL
jgi:hypothetical protein